MGTVAALSLLGATRGAAAANLYGSDNTGNLVLINTNTGAGALIGTEMNFPLSTELVYDLATGTLYSEEFGGGPGFHTLSTVTGLSTGFVSHNPGSINGLEFVGGTLYGTYIPFSGQPSTLEIINPLTGAMTTVGPTGMGPISGLAYDAPNNIMYGVIGGGAVAAILNVNLAIGATTIGPVLIDSASGVAITHVGSIEYASDGVLYGGTGMNANINPGWLFSINPLTGMCTFIGPTGLNGVTGLANPTQPAPPGTMYGSDNAGNLFTVNLTTGAGTLIGTEVTFPLSTEIEFDNAAGALYSEEFAGGSQLHKVNPATGLSTGAVPHLPGSINGLEFVGGQLYGTHIPGSLAPSTLEIINPTTGMMTTIGPTGFGPISGLAEDVTTGTVYGVTAGGSTAILLTMNLAIGAAMPGPVLFDIATGNQLAHVGSIEFGSNGVLYGGMGINGNINPGWLFSINPASGACTFIGPTGFQGVTGLTLSTTAVTPAQLIGSDSVGNLFRINTGSGAAGLIGTDMTFPLSTEIEVDPATGRLFSEEHSMGSMIHYMNAHNGKSFKFVGHMPGMFNGMEYIGGQLYATYIPGNLAPSTLELVDPILGTMMTVGPTGFGPISGLAQDPATGQVYGVSAGGTPAILLNINLASGAAIPGPALIDIASGLPLVHVGSIEYASDGVLYGGMGNNGNINPGWLFSINPATGFCTFIGPTGFMGVTGLADPTSTCTGDANGDLLVDVNDIGYVLFRIPTSPCPGPPGCPGDVNLDGFIDVNDIGYVLFRLGKHCP